MRKEDKPTHYAVVYDDQELINCMMGPDPECAGALCTCQGEVSLFSSTAKARQAIRISNCWARLRQAQGLPTNDDFLPPTLRHVKVVPCRETP